MQKLDDLLRSMTFDFFGNGNHKITPTKLFTENNALFLDVRSREEYKSLSFSLEHHIPSLHIPINEIPERINEIPKDKLIGIFCPASIRATMVYSYLKILDYQVRIVEGGYDGLTTELKPGNVYKHIYDK